MSISTIKKPQISSTYEYNNKPTFNYNHITPNGVWKYDDGEQIFIPNKPINTEVVR